MKLCVSVQKLENHLFATVADKELTNKKIKEGRFQIDLRSKFYKWEEKEPNEVEKVIRDSSHILFLGKKAISFALSKGVLNKKDITEISNVPLCHVFKIR